MVPRTGVATLGSDPHDWESVDYIRVLSLLQVCFLLFPKKRVLFCSAGIRNGDLLMTCRTPKPLVNRFIRSLHRRAAMIAQESNRGHGWTLGVGAGDPDCLVRTDKNQGKRVEKRPRSAGLRRLTTCLRRGPKSLRRKELLQSNVRRRGEARLRARRLQIRIKRLPEVIGKPERKRGTSSPALRFVFRHSGVHSKDSQ